MADESQTTPREAFERALSILVERAKGEGARSVEREEVLELEPSVGAAEALSQADADLKRARESVAGQWQTVVRLYDRKV